MTPILPRQPSCLLPAQAWVLIWACLSTCRKGDRIYHQLKKLGSSLDWNRACFTMDPVSRRGLGPGAWVGGKLPRASDPRTRVPVLWPSPRRGAQHPWGTMEGSAANSTSRPLSRPFVTYLELRLFLVAHDGPHSPVEPKLPGFSSSAPVLARWLPCHPQRP